MIENSSNNNDSYNGNNGSNNNGNNNNNDNQPSDHDDIEDFFSRKRRQGRWNASIIIKFLDAIREFPVLWDQNDPNYMDRVLSLGARIAAARTFNEQGE